MERADSSILDQIRLLSLESLYRKTVEYHHNYHSYLPSPPSSASSPAERHSRGANNKSLDMKLYGMVEVTSFDDEA
jgi:hypothetical protein